MKYKVIYSRRFQKQLKKIVRSGRRDFQKLEVVVNLLRDGNLLPSQYRDHALVGKLQSFRECHVAPDWLLIYQRHEDILVLELVMTGSHSELFK